MAMVWKGSIAAVMRLFMRDRPVRRKSDPKHIRLCHHFRA